jgi:hypothetical protein
MWHRPPPPARPIERQENAATVDTLEVLAEALQIDAVKLVER